MIAAMIRPQTILVSVARVEVAVGRHHADDVGPGIGAGDQEDVDQQDAEDVERRGPRQVAEEREQRRGHVLHDVLGEPAAAEHLDVEGRAAEDREPEHREQRRDQDHADAELADRAPAADPGDEDADERPPGDPPDQVGQRPAVGPLPQRLVVGEDPERQLDDAAQVVADRGDEDVEDERRRAGEQHEQHDDHGDHHVEVAQELDALVDPGAGRDQEHHRHRDEDVEAHHVVGGRAEHLGHPAAGHQGAHGERAGDAEDHREDADDVGRLRQDRRQARGPGSAAASTRSGAETMAGAPRRKVK